MTLRILLTLFVTLLVACGADDTRVSKDHSQEQTEQPKRWTHYLHELSLTPGCYVPPPLQRIPEDASEAWARQQASSAEWRGKIGMSCASMYRNIVRNLRAAPEADDWEFNTEDVTLRTIASDHVGDIEGFFRTDTATATGGYGSCPLPRPGFGKFTTNYSYVEQISGPPVNIAWTDNSVTVYQVVWAFSIGYLHRGCDPATGISYGLLIGYDPTSNMHCWNDLGEFVSCDGVDVWPYRD